MIDRRRDRKHQPNETRKAPVKSRNRYREERNTESKPDVQHREIKRRHRKQKPNDLQEGKEHHRRQIRSGH
ncbi:hypothetical protein N665_0428s0022 [Sinapis alba]|nr:hypothetical protein N665_0428s0022 [Sinapis alba]